MIKAITFTANLNDEEGHPRLSRHTLHAKTLDKLNEWLTDDIEIISISHEKGRGNFHSEVYDSLTLYYREK